MANPGLELHQKTFRTRVAFRFFDGHVEYAIVDGKGDRASFSSRYEDIPPKFDYRTFEPRRPVAYIQIFALMGVALALILLYPKESLLMFAFMAVYGSALVGLSSLAHKRWFRKIYTSIPTPNGKLLVLRNGMHDGILSELEERRRKALRKFAMIDALGSPLAELRRLKWLKEEGAITALEFETYRRALGPAAVIASRPAPPSDFLPLTIVQKASHFHAVFDFHDDYLDYRVNEGALAEFKMHYKDLPHTSEYTQVTTKDGIASFVLCLGALLGMALMNHVANDPYFATKIGELQALVGTALYVPAFAALVWLAPRASRKEFTVLPVSKGAIRILQDAHRDRIIGEIQNRRHAALRARAVVDAANSPQEELRKFVWLREQGAITGAEFENFRDKIMDSVADRRAAPMPVRPPTETLH
jgi:hypothetical protein